jgi:signal transduction histidine kinase
MTTGLHGEDGTHIGFGKVFRDATDVKEQLEMLRSRADALLSADQHKNIFLSTLSHELRNPLAPLTNALHLMRLAAPADHALEYPMKLIERQVDFIRRLVDDLLDVTRISAGKIQLERGRIDLREVLAHNDAYPALDRLGDLIKWGPTLTNVGDVHVLLTMRA